MRLKVFVTLVGLLSLVFTSFSQTSINPTQRSYSSPAPTDKERLKRLKKSLDASFNEKFNKVIILVKTPDNKLIEVKNQFPDEVEITFNLFKDNFGRLIIFKEIPFIESGDDYIEITHYFDSAGRTFAIKKFHNYFDEHGAVYWTRTVYYDNNFREIDNVETLLDENDKPLKRDADFEFPYKSEDQPNKESCLKLFADLQKATISSTFSKVEDFLIPGSGNNKVTYYMPTKSHEKSDATKTLYFKKTEQGYDILDARFVQGRTTSIATSSIAIVNNEARIVRSVTTNMLETNHYQTFSPSILLLKVPPKGGTTSWKYKDPGGDVYNCTASWTYDRVEEDGVIKKVPVIKVAKTTSALEGTTLEFYRKGDGIVREEFRSRAGELFTMFQVHSFSHDDEVERANLFKK